VRLQWVSRDLDILQELAEASAHAREGLRLTDLEKMGEVMESDSAARRGRRLSVGSRGSTRQARGSGLVGDPGLRKSGTIIEDHGDVVAGSARS